MCPRSKRKHYVEDLVKHCYAIYVCVCVRVWMYVNVRCVLFVNNKKKEKKNKMLIEHNEKRAGELWRYETLF